MVQIYYLERNNIPFYIGKTKNNFLRREHAHRKRLLDDSINLHVIDNIKECDWIFWESWYISLFKSWGFTLENKNEGGGGPTNHTKNTKHKISKALKHRSYSSITIERMKVSASKPKTDSFIGKIRKPVLQYDINGTLIKEWESSKHAAIALYGYYNDNIGMCCRGQLKKARGYIWKWKSLAIKE